MSAPPYMKLYIGDYLADTTHLTRGEHGAYLLLLMAMWRAGGKLPADDRKLAKIALCSADEWADMRVTILDFFRRRGGCISHKRVARELVQYSASVGASKKAGLASAAKRASKSKGVGPTPADDALNEKPTNQNHNQNQKERELTLSLIDGGLSPTMEADFEAWWALYPRKVGKIAARKSFARARKAKVSTASLIDGVKRAKWPTDLQFIPHPATWLNEGRWMDAPAPSASENALRSNIL